MRCDNNINNNNNNILLSIEYRLYLIKYLDLFKELNGILFSFFGFAPKLILVFLFEP